MAVPELSVEVVGNAFVSQYYNILHNSPEHVHKFFQDTSTMSRPTPDGSLTTVTSMEGIKDLVASLACHEYRAEIMTADAQASFKEGVIVLVTGRLTGKDNIRRKFSETFFLAPQDPGYYVHNNVFRFIDEDGVPVVNSQESKDFMHSTSTPTIPESVPDATEVLDKSQPEVVVDTEDVSDEPLEAEEPSSEITAVKESLISSEPPAEVTNQKDDQPVPVLATEVPEDAPKKSYASIVKVMKESKDTASVHTPKTARPSSTNNGQLPQVVKSSAAVEQANGPVASNGGQQSVEAVPPTSAQVSAVAIGKSENGNGITDQAEDKGYSVYIGDLPYNATVSLVENEFKKFGPIKRDGIQVRCNKGFCFGFIEFESVDSMKKAVQASKIQIGGHDTFIQEKKTSTRVVNGVTSFAPGNGRGVYRNFRGRGNYSGGGRGGGYGGRNDYGRRGGDYYPNGARNGGDGGGGGGYQRDRAYQNSRGRRGSQQVNGGN